MPELLVKLLAARSSSVFCCRQGFDEISAVDLRKEAGSIPEKTHLYWLSAQDRVGGMPWASC